MRRGMRKAECNCGDDGMAHLRHDILARFRGVRRPDCMNTFAPEGVGNAGCPLHPQPRAQSVVKHTS
jgi:hypothetical protein